MFIYRLILLFSVVLFVSLSAVNTSFAADKEIALTIDDLPFVGANNMNERSIKRSNDRIQAIIQTLIDHKIPATGFIIGEALCKEQRPLLEELHAHGFSLGNHTYTHKSLNNLSAEKYIADIDKADKKIGALMTEPKYFRYPYLAEGTGAKKQAVYDYLAKEHYVIAPVTIDSKDYNFNAQLLSISWRNREAALKGMKARYLSYIWKQTLRAEAIAARHPEVPHKQILLIHANLLNSHFLGDIIDMYQKNNYVFIPLKEALRGQHPDSTIKAVEETAASGKTKDSNEKDKLDKTSKTSDPSASKNKELISALLFLGVMFG